MIKIHRFVVSPLATNCYVLHDDSSNKAVIIDPGDKSALLDDFLEQVSVEYILMTHGHIDHIGAVEYYKKRCDAPVYSGIQEKKYLQNETLNGAQYLGIPFVPFECERYLDDGDMLEFQSPVQVFHTPGHTPGGISFYLPEEGLVFTGDTLFQYSIGRTDLPGGDIDQIIQSIKLKLFILPNNTQVYPGHMSKTTIEVEKAGNPFIT